MFIQSLLRDTTIIELISEEFLASIEVFEKEISSLTESSLQFSQSLSLSPKTIRKKTLHETLKEYGIPSEGYSKEGSPEGGSSEPSEEEKDVLHTDEETLLLLKVILTLT